MPSLDSFKSKRTLTVGSKTYTYFSLSAAAENGLGDVSRLPASLKVLLENMLRHEDGKTVTTDDIKAVAHPVLRHRIITNFTAQAEGKENDDVIDELLKLVKE